ncbi:MAG: putative DNA binding domain-containing protein [Candidatus Methanoplasma sp.]|jgi:ATP-dependent DNA helicase RecG|nr:putative DNA binding domain-containing protein [Candidatus Methanoplasma sp.]
MSKNPEVGEMEDDATEWKSEWKTEHLKVIASFANTGGGTLHIGVGDDGAVMGVENAAELLKVIPDAIATNLGIVCEVSHRKVDGKEVVSVTVEKHDDPVLFKGHAYIRSGSTVQELKGSKLRDFHVRAKPLSWADVPVASLSPEDMLGQAFDAFKERAEMYRRLTKAEIALPIEALLDKLGLMNNGHPTRAAALLFRNDALKVSRGACIRIGRISGANLMFQDELKGPMYLVADQAVGIVLSKYCMVPITYDGIIRVENQPYPEEALREAIINAIVNTDYSENEPIMIRVYDDYLDITHVGGLPDGVSLETIIKNQRSMPRNGGMAATFRAAYYVESFGRGFRLMLDSYLEMGGSPPTFDSYANRFVAKLPNIVFEKGIVPRDMKGRPVSPTNGAGVPEALSYGEAKIYKGVREASGASTAKDIAARLGIACDAASRYLGLLESRGLVKRSGSRESWVWSASDLF